MSQNGKGDKRRPGNEAAFRANYDKIFMKKKTDPVKEYRLVQDESCHWYVIEVGQEEFFDQWLRSYHGEGVLPPDGFEPDRIDGYHSIAFTGWRGGLR